MSPTHHRAVFAAFAIVAAGVVINVAVLQPTSGPVARASIAPALVLSEQLVPQTPARVETKPRVVASAQPSEQGARRFARLRPDAAHVDRSVDTLPEAPDAEGDAKTIGAIQRELSQRGYGQLTSDGVPGLVTRAAIMAFEYDHQMPLKGEATPMLLARIVLGGAASTVVDATAGQVRSSDAETVMRTVQQSLAALGYQVGKIDGRTGDDIARAIREFELDTGMKPTGRVSADIFVRLGRAVASQRPKPVQ